MKRPQTLLDKLWQHHLVRPEAIDVPAVLYIDLHLVHEVTSPQAFAALRRRGLKVRRPDRTLATIDHVIPSTKPGLDGRLSFVSLEAERQVGQLELNCASHGIELLGLEDPRRGIVHVIGPELGLSQPGMTIVCGDSHTSTHGALGALAFGIGTGEVEHVLATQCLLQRKPKAMAVQINGTLRGDVTAKDLALAVVAKVGSQGGTGHVIEFMGPAVEQLSIEERMTLCNMSIEAGARAGMVAPDDVTFAYLNGRDYAPKQREWDQALERWRQLRSDSGASFDAIVEVNASEIRPMITFGTNPDMAIPVDGRVPSPRDETDQAALSYMGLEPGELVLGREVHTVFIGSCTNARLSDLRRAAEVLRNRRVSTRCLVVPGSLRVKRQAEREGLDKIFIAAGAEWREPSCSMCIAMNGDRLEPGQYSVSTSNRNFQGRQGKNSRTILASPETAAASAVNGAVCGMDQLMEVCRGSVW